MRVIGIDPGSQSFDIFGIDSEDNSIFIDTSILTRRVMKDPQILLDLIKSQEPFDYLAAPSGFGLPLKKIQDLSEQDLFEIVLRRPSSKPTMGLQKVIELIKKTDWNSFIIPGVKHLPTVPSYRKVNKIDIGTSDKVCAAVVGVKDMMETHDLKPNETNFIMIELGAAFSAVLGIKNGEIIDGIGGSNLLGFKAAGPLDGEIAYLMDKITKKKIYNGGISSIVGYPEMTPDEILLLAKKDKQSAMALDAFVESVVKGVFSVWASFSPDCEVQNILLSGRLSKNQYFVDEISKKLKCIATVKVMKSYANIAKRAAQGAAYIAEGLHDGPSKEIIETLQIEHASGSILDNIYLDLDSDHN